MRYKKPKYIEWFVKNPEEIKLDTGESLVVYSINHQVDDSILDEWGKHISQHYIDDYRAEERAHKLKVSKEEYLKSNWFDLAGKDISGNFAEIVFSDFIEFVLGFQVPRYKLFNNYPGNPQHGIDLFGFKFNEKDSTKDIVNFMEVKAVLSKKDYSTISSSVEDINKRTDKQFALILENAHEKLFSLGCFDEVTMIERFQDSEKQCIRLKSSGAITISDTCTSDDFIGLKVTNGLDVMIHLIHGNDLLNVAKDLYRRACK